MSIPVYILTGYLGAGKTTAMNHLLSLPLFAERTLALIINEFGPQGVDGSLVRSGRHRRFELNRGSLFCICIKTDFLKTLDTIASDVRPDCVLVEATGVADPCDLEQFIDEPHLARRFHIQAQVCLVDAAHFTKVAPYMRTAERQVQWADGLVINKTDLAPEEALDRLAAVLRALNPDAPQARVTHGRTPAAFLEGLTHRVRRGAAPDAPPEGFAAVSCDTGGAVSREAFQALVAGFGDHLVRMKGTAEFGKGRRYVETVLGGYSERAGGDGTRPVMTFITWGLAKEEVRSRVDDLFGRQ